MTHTTHARIAALVAAGFLATAAGTVHADTTTSGNGSIGGGNQLDADVDAPINACGNSIAVLGVAGANCTDSSAITVDEPAPAPAPEPEPEPEPEPDDSSTRAPHDGYDDYEPEEPEEEPSEEESAPPEKEEEEETEPPVEESEAPKPSEDTVTPELARTGLDGVGLAALVTAALAVAAAGVGLIVFGRRRTRA